MAHVELPFIQCDLCPIRHPAGSPAAKEFTTVDELDICPKCFGAPFEAISLGVREAWERLSVAGDGTRNRKVLDILKRMCYTAIHNHAGGEETGRRSSMRRGHRRST